ncbi:CU044_5270 family protein [Actinomadura sediminis]|uniref:CU044_5270 family protein n=1 Tax=Actinomadura sediminis TaxID=1038904 RepID=A0ABW3EJ80_9ACTN
MDEIDALRGMRTTLAEEEPPEALATRIDWRNDRRSAPPKRERRRPRFALPLVSVVAAGAAAVAAVALVPDGGDGGEVRAAPGNVLLAAAENAEKAPTARFWHTETVTGDVFAVGKSAKNHYKVDSRQRVVNWVGPDGKGTSTNVDVPDRPLTMTDAQKWQAAGSPGKVEVPDPEGGPRNILYLNETINGPSMPLDGEYHGLSAEEIRALPTEPEALKEALRGLKGRWHAYTSDETGEEPIRALEGEAETRALSEVAGTLLSTAPTPPKVRAAAFRMLATLPGVRAGGQATDRMGRTGVAVTLPLKTITPLGIYTAPKRLGTYTRQWIVDPGEGALLEIRDLVATPPKGSRAIPPGDDGKPRSIEAANMPDRFHKPGELAGYQLFAVAEWTNDKPK